MKNTELLFSYNGSSSKGYRFDSNCKAVVIDLYDKELNQNTILGIIGCISSYRKKYKAAKIPVIIKFNYVGIKIKDKLSYILLECICFSLIKEFDTHVQVLWKPHPDIFTLGVNSSPLLLLNGTKISSVKKYPLKFQREIYSTEFQGGLQSAHYRTVVNGNQKDDKNELSSMYSDIDTFLKMFEISEQYRDEICEVIAELVGNAKEHSHSDCLIDIDVTSDHRKQSKGKVVDGAYYGINIVILNFSNQLLSSGIREKIIDNKIQIHRYGELFATYNNHKLFFDDDYTEEDFFNISVFQDKISGRNDKISSGGIGLTVLIKTLEQQSDTSRCYVISGKKAIFFHESVLDYDDNGWIGFNSSKDFKYQRPDKACLGKSMVYMPGTAFNLHFIMKRENENG